MSFVSAKTHKKIESVHKAALKLKAKIDALTEDGGRLGYAEENIEDAQENLERVIDELSSALSSSDSFGITP